MLRRVGHFGKVEGAVGTAGGLGARRRRQRGHFLIDFGRAERLLGGHNESWYWGAIWRGDLYRKLGELKKAEGWDLAARWHPVAHERLGQLYEEMERSHKATEAFERFIEARKNADAELQARLREARERLDALREKKSAE